MSTAECPCGITRSTCTYHKDQVRKVEIKAAGDPTKIARLVLEQFALLAEMKAAVNHHVAPSAIKSFIVQYMDNSFVTITKWGRLKYYSGGYHVVDNFSFDCRGLLSPTDAWAAFLEARCEAYNKYGFVGEIT
jgi:hypothetical protein